MRGSSRLRKQRVISESESDNEAPKNTRVSYPKRKSRKLPNYETSEEEDEDSMPAQKRNTKSGRSKPKNDDSSSESDIENYLQHPSEMDFKSIFFQVDRVPEKTEFENIESNILENVNVERMSDSDPNEKMEIAETQTQVNFQTLHKYTKDMDEAKKVIQKYEASKKKAKTKESNVSVNDISNLLALGETKRISEVSQNSDSFSDSEKEDWEEIEHNEVEEDETAIVPKEGLEVVVELPGGGVKKKKEVDMLASIKRRLNRVRKENQVLVHKVHLLCWLAHGNYVNKTLNNETLMALALSLLPSQHCYPPERTDLNYLEQIVNWYRDLVHIVEKENPQDVTLEELMKSQINSRTAHSKQMLVYIFVCILRSLGIQCRLVLSFQVEPLRPPASDLHSLSTKIEDEKSTATGSSSIKQKPSSSTKKDGAKPGPSSKKQGTSSSIKKDDAKAGTSSSIKKDDAKAGTSSSIKKDDAKAGTSSSIKKNDIKTRPSRGSVPKKEEKVDKKSILKKNADKPSSPKNLQTTSTGRSLPRKQEKEISSKKVPAKQNGKGSSSKELSSKISEDSGCSSEGDRDDKNRSYDIAEKDKMITKKILDRLQTEQEKRKLLEEKSRSKTSRKSQRLSVTPKVKSKKEVKSKGESKPGTSKENNVPSDNPKTRSKNGNKTEVDGETKRKSLKVETKSKQIVAKKSLSSTKTPSLGRLKLRSSVKISQVDGMNDTDSESESSQKPNLKRLSQEKTDSCPVKQHEKRLKSQRSCKKPQKEQSSLDESSDDDFEPVREKKPNLKNLKKVDKTKPSSSVSTKSQKRPSRASGSGSAKQVDVRNDIISIMKTRISAENAVQRKKLVKNRKSRNSSGEDSDYVPVEIKKKPIDSDDEFHEKTKIKVKQRVKTKKMLEQEAAEVKKKKGVDVWVEVFLESEEKWITADLIKGKVHCVSEIYSRASHPVSYIVAWNNDNSIKDVTQRYCVNWNTVTRKLRVDPKWWEKSMRAFVTRKTARDREEDEELARLQLEKPLPTTVSEYKNHPLYALERHLLKYEAFYPPNPTILGFIRKEPVYSRDCVFTLHSRESWFKYAKVVKRGEQPYKIVLRPKWDKINRKILKNQPLEAFGEWQVEQYVPPPAENGIVPKNEYGNVDLFQKSMLPKGTVHLQLPALNKVARKMNIDCPPAMVGFDVHHGWTHPVFDGFVVCEEHSEALIAAWYLEQEEVEKREKEKIEKRVYDNWKKLIKGLLIRERLEARYKFGESSNSAPGGSKRKQSTSKFTKNKKQKTSESEKDK